MWSRSASAVDSNREGKPPVRRREFGKASLFDHVQIESGHKLSRSVARQTRRQSRPLHYVVQPAARSSWCAESPAMGVSKQW